MKILKKGIIGFTLILFILGSVYAYFGGLSTGDCANTEEFKKYANEVNHLSIPKDKKIVALGEATHGNVEFQQLKLEVFQKLVEENDIRAFAIEGDFGGCEVVNRYIHGQEGSVKEAVAAIGFAIYRTQEMEDLVEWMKSYNQEHNNVLSFYGYDMQRLSYNYQFLLEKVDGNSDLEKIWDCKNESFSKEYTLNQIEEILNNVKSELTDPQAIHCADILLQNIKLSQVEDLSSQGNILRDQFMANNTLWILAREQEKGNTSIFITGHNGHVAKTGSYEVMGSILSDTLSEDYFVIGTDFYKSSCNLPRGNDGKRENHTFYSHDPLAKASKKAGFEKSYLDFSKIDRNTELYKTITSPLWMGSLGEYYNFFYMNLLPMTYRIKNIPQAMYDSMIFVSEAHPTELR
ncbi:MAG: erythromycin esterase family protein [Bacillota bacterium]|nr:erythromycin esterase family protein [Bacillota bacterium]